MKPKGLDKLQWVPFGNPVRTTLSQHGHSSKQHQVAGCVQLGHTAVKKKNKFLNLKEEVLLHVLSDESLW